MKTSFIFFKEHFKTEKNSWKFASISFKDELGIHEI